MFHFSSFPSICLFWNIIEYFCTAKHSVKFISWMYLVEDIFFVEIGLTKSFILQTWTDSLCIEVSFS